MSDRCGYCGGVVSDRGHRGRPWPNIPAATYCCFGCLSLGEQDRQERSLAPGTIRSKPTFDAQMARLGLALMIAGQSMAFSLALNLNDDVSVGVRGTLHLAILLGTLAVVGMLGWPLAHAAWTELRRFRLTIEALFVLTMTGAMTASLQAYVTGRGKIYFEVVSILLIVYTLGKIVSAKSRAAAIASSRAWAGQLATCRLVDAHGRTRNVPVSEIVVGDLVDVDPGETIPVDGVICAGEGFLSEGVITGEPYAVVRRPGDSVRAGSASHDVTLRVRATSPGTDRQVDRLLAVVDAARRQPTSLQAQADLLGQWFFPLVVGTAMATFVGWAAFSTAGWQTALFNAMSVLLVACPCVIGLATPILVWSAVGRLAERGLIVGSSEVVERLAGVTHVIFDKTGTLTESRFDLVDIATVATGSERAKILGWIATVQARSRHPVAAPFAGLPRPFSRGREPRVASIRAVPGCGIEAQIIEPNGEAHRLRIGRPDWLRTADPSAADSPQLLSGLPAMNDHRIDVELDGGLAAIAVVRERLRESVPNALADLERLGLSVEVLTGDRTDRAEALHLTAVRGDLLPDDKRARIVEIESSGGKPLMVGDGINDASALAQAHVGIAMASGTDIAVGSATATLYHDDLRVVPWAIELSRTVVRAVRYNLWRAAAYNIVGMTLAALGFLHPVLAALLMVASSLTLIFSAVRVGVAPNHCDSDSAGPAPPDRPGNAAHLDERIDPVAAKALIHFLALAGQGVVVLLLVGSLRPIAVGTSILAGFSTTALILAWTWKRWPTIPHTVDMSYGMLTAGNLGMLLGWWADAQFNTLQFPECGCGPMFAATASRPWMPVGMLVASTAAMAWLERSPATPNARHTASMYTGGNLGMLAGMTAGGWLAGFISSHSFPIAFGWHFAGMTAGMLGGMLAGTWLTERALAACVNLYRLPHWIRLARSASPDPRV